MLKNEYVVFSAHLDHVGFANAPNESGDNISNGADDDGSGSAALMAIARAYAQGAAKGIKPKRTMIFLWVAGEEKGLWGSQYFNQFPPIDITKVVADLNMDMIGRTKTPGYVDPPQYKLVEPGEVFVVGPDISSTDLGKVVDAVAAAYKLKINHFYDTTAPDRRPRQPRAAAERPADLLPQRPLQLREERHPDRVLRGRPARRLSPGDRQPGEDRLRQHAGDHEDGVRGRLDGGQQRRRARS